MDEIDFKMGEPIAVLEKDEEYDDGWWRASWDEGVDDRVKIFVAE